MTRYDASVRRYETAKTVLAGGVSSNFRYHSLPAPLAIDRGEGPHVWDADGNRYIDYVLGNGPAFLGHSPATVLDAVRDSLADGQAFTSVHQAEIDLAERLVELIPCAERVRFDVSGTQAGHIALRLARAHTGRQKIVKFEGHYHGWADNIFLSLNPTLAEAGSADAPAVLTMSDGQSDSVRGDALVATYNDLARLTALVERNAEDIAAIVLEPVPCNTGVIEPRPGYLEGVRELCDRHGIVLVFDEVITGFRAALGGAQQRFGVTPDLAIFAKAVASGFPMSVIAGRADIMDGVMSGVVHGGTYNAITSTVAACRATVETLAEGGDELYAAIERRGQRLIEGFNDIGRRHGLPLHAQGLGTVFTTVFTESPPLTDYRDYKASDESLRLQFVQALQDAGVRTTARGTWFMSAVHTDDDIDETLSAADAAASTI